jgi:hypothetical protein
MHSRFQPVIYSTEEREIGVWTDGKPLYKKTCQITSNTNVGDWTTLTLTNPISDIENIYKVEMNSGSPSGYGSGNYVFRTNNGNVQVKTTTNSSTTFNASWVFSLFYTKTTDTAGSGTWTPQGVPAVHYSTDEQIVGDYFGDTLYQKTIVLASGVSIADSWTTIYTDALIGNIAQLVDVKYNNVDNKGVYGVLNYKPNGNNLQAVYPISGGLNVLAGARFTLWYTKSS